MHARGREGCRSETRDGNGRSREQSDKSDRWITAGWRCDRRGRREQGRRRGPGRGRGRGSWSAWPNESMDLAFDKKMGGGGERGQRGQRSVRRRLIWNGRGRVEFELSNDERAGPSSVRSGWSRRSSTAKTGGLGLPEHCALRAAGRRGSTVRMGWAGDWVFGGLEICRQPCESLRGSRVGGGGCREDPFWVVVWCLFLGGPGQSSGGPGSLCWNCRWFCGSVGVPPRERSTARSAGGPASSALQVRGRVGME